MNNNQDVVKNINENNKINSTEPKTHLKNPSGVDNLKPVRNPLELEFRIKGLRTSAIVMAFISVLSVYFILWAIFYIILAVKMNPKRAPDRGLVKAAAILTIPLSLSLIPLFIDIEFWKMNKRLREYEDKGNSAFMTDEEWIAGEPKRKRNKRTTWIVLLTLLTLLVGLFFAVLLNDGFSSLSPTPTTKAADAVQEYKSTKKLPEKLDENTTLVQVTSSGSTIQFHNTIEGLDNSVLSNSILFNIVKPNVCSLDSAKSLLESNIDIQYLYTVMETDVNYSITIRNGDCG